ncbi:MAG TPA: hypothetical protein PK771_01835 [Spirochaetota bacterium]|nr:hypothetical protein [Spirochaetota bacterium]
MIYNAIIKDGGIFIPNVDGKILKKSKTRIDILLISNDDKIDIITKTNGILKEKKLDGLEFERMIRSEWGE